MELQSILAVLSGLGLPVAYDHFREAAKLPCLTVKELSADFMLADNKIYHMKQGWLISLYTDAKRPDTEKTVESRLDEYGLIWQKSDTIWISAEQMYEINYTI